MAYRSEEYMVSKKMLINFRTKLQWHIPFVYEGKEESICNMKSLSMSVWAGWQIKGKYKNCCYLKTTSQNHQIFYVHV